MGVEPPWPLSFASNFSLLSRTVSSLIPVFQWTFCPEAPEILPTTPEFPPLPVTVTAKRAFQGPGVQETIPSLRSPPEGQLSPHQRSKEELHRHWPEMPPPTTITSHLLVMVLSPLRIFRCQLLGCLGVLSRPLSCFCRLGGAAILPAQRPWARSPARLPTRWPGKSLDTSPFLGPSALTCTCARAQKSPLTSKSPSQNPPPPRPSNSIFLSTFLQTDCFQALKLDLYGVSLWCQDCVLSGVKQYQEEFRSSFQLQARCSQYILCMLPGQTYKDPFYGRGKPLVKGLPPGPFICWEPKANLKQTASVTSL